MAKIKKLFKKEKIFGSALAFLGLILSFYTVLTPVNEYIKYKYDKISHKMQLEVHNLYLDGYVNSDYNELVKLINIKKGQKILSVDLGNIRNRIDSYNWVKTSFVERHLPNIIYVKIEERKPSFLWQNRKKLHLIDEEGEIIKVSKLTKFRDLPIIVGDNAPTRAGYLFEKIRKFESLSKNISSASFISERRWDLKLFDGTIIKLPEENLESALQLATNLIAKKENKDFKIIDLRVNGKIFLS